MDTKSRPFRPESVDPHRFSWKRVGKRIALAAVLIGNWLFSLGSIAIAAMTRDSVVLFRPSNTYIIVSTFFMLAGVVLLSIQLVAVINFLMHGHAPPDH